MPEYEFSYFTNRGKQMT